MISHLSYQKDYLMHLLHFISLTSSNMYDYIQTSQILNPQIFVHEIFHCVICSYLWLLCLFKEPFVDKTKPTKTNR